MKVEGDVECVEWTAIVREDWKKKYPFLLLLLFLYPMKAGRGGAMGGGSGGDKEERA